MTDEEKERLDLKYESKNKKGTEEIPIEAIDYTKLQVVRGEYFAHLREPTISFKGNKISFNAACYNRLPEIDYIQVLVNPEDKKLIIRPSSEDEKDSFPWCTKGAKRASKNITCRVFFAKIIDLTGWNLDYRYKLLGKLVRSNMGELVFSFDLTSVQTFPCYISENEKMRMSRSPIFPQEWQTEFGLSFEEHQKRVKTNYVKGYAVISLADKEIVAGEQSGIPEVKNEQGDNN